MDDDTEDFMDELEDDEGGVRRQLDEGGDFFMDGSVVDIAVFPLVRSPLLLTKNTDNIATNICSNHRM